MIVLRQAQDERTFVARLTAKASHLAKARAEERLRAAKRDPWRWRRPTLLWPLFTGDR